jgi:hypothetical protein
VPVALDLPSLKGLVWFFAAYPGLPPEAKLISLLRT